MVSYTIALIAVPSAVVPAALPGRPAIIPIGRTPETVQPDEGRQKSDMSGAPVVERRAIGSGLS
ncbi:hypothetical protein [Micromonospora chersina]|uniref:hypothetical protein n=1 Tax=Micromonospora chersina TaxID=47854 RepID=UPI0037160B03